MMTRKEKPEPTPIDWAEFVEEVRLRELARRFSRPSQMLHRHSEQWRERYDPPLPTWLGGRWLTEKQKVDRTAARANLLARMAALTRKD